MANSVRQFVIESLHGFWNRLPLKKIAVNGTEVTPDSDGVADIGSYIVTPGSVVTDVTVDGTSVVTNGVAEVPTEIFLATYGTTTFQQVTTALSENKLVLLPKDDLVYTIQYVTSTKYRFGVLKSTRQVTWYDLNSDDTWALYGNATLEITASKVTSLSSSSTDTQYPSAKCVYDNLQDKADKVTGATSGNFAGLDSNGDLTDSGYDASDFLSSSTTLTTITFRQW